jgi:hypothetical protein
MSLFGLTIASWFLDPRNPKNAFRLANLPLVGGLILFAWGGAYMDSFG